MKSIDIELPETETKLPPSAGSGRFTYVGPTRPKAIEGDVKDIETVDLVEMVNPAAETPFTVKPDYTGQPVSAGGQPSAGRYILPDRFTRGRQQPRPIEAQEPPNLPMPSVPLDKDELQARTEQLDKELGEQVRQNISDLLGDGAAKGIYDKWIGKDLTGLGGYFKENNITNASPMDAALATLSLAQGEMGGMSQEDRMKDFAEKMELAISKLAFKGVDLSNITGIDAATLSYPTDVWNNLALQPNWTSTLSIGDVQPDISITNVQGIQAGNINMDEVWQNMPPEHREALQQQLDLSSGIVPEILSDEFGQLKGDWNFGIPPLLQFGGPDSGVTIDISPILTPIIGLQPNWGNTLNIGDVGISQVPIEHIGSGGKISLFVPNRIPTKFDLDAGVITPPRHSTPGP